MIGEGRQVQTESLAGAVHLSLLHLGTIQLPMNQDELVTRNRFGWTDDPRVQREQKEIVHDAAIFAFKLWLDGLKDVALAFLCLGAAAIDLVRGRGAEGYRFYRLMRFGRRVDAVLDLYGTRNRNNLESGVRDSDPEL